MVPVFSVRNIKPLIEAVHWSDNDDCTFYWGNWVIPGMRNVISNLKSIFGSAVCGTIFQLLCPLFEFVKNDCFIFILMPLTRIIIVFIIGKFECWLGKKPGLGNICEFWRYYGILGSVRRKGDRVKSKGRKAENESLRLVAHAEVGERREQFREARE